MRIDFRDHQVHAQAWGPGGDWLLHRVRAMTGANDAGFEFADAHPAIMSAQHLHRGLRFGASGTLYHELLPTILGQRITAGEGLQQWRQLVQQLGERAPGPDHGLRLPPTADALLSKPTWWFHPLGIEVKRATSLLQVAKHAPRLDEWALLPPAAAAAKLSLLPGIGRWTVGSVMATALGDPDALAVGDYHLKNVVVHALTGRARGSDEEMLELLAPYVGQRGRAARLLSLAGHGAPKFGPRQRVRPIGRW